MTATIEQNGVTYEITHHLVPDVLDQGGHIYRLIETKPHINRKCEPSWILTWRGRCARCGSEFDITTGPNVARHLNRRCPLHHNPSARAKPWKDGAR